MDSYLEYGNKRFKLQKGYKFKMSNSQVTFQDVTIDFTDGTIADIPYKYQECKIIKNNEVIFFGFLDTPKISTMKIDAQKEGRELTLTLLSPLKMATIRTITLIGTYAVRTAVTRILQPLIDDGYTIKEMNIADGQITVNFILATVEYCMNNIGFKRNIFWFINEKKEIFINSVEYLFAKVPSAEITEQTGRESGLHSIQPTIDDIDYANIINFKNVRLIYSTMVDVTDYPVVKADGRIKKGDTITFDNPIILDENFLRNNVEESVEKENYFYDLDIVIVCDNGTLKTYYSRLNLMDSSDSNTYNKYLNSGNFSFNNDGGDEKEIVLQRDQFFSNLITGFKWNVDSSATIIIVRSDTALRYTTMKFVYSNEIEKLKGIISVSGQIEKTIDYNSKWTTLKQLITYARSLIVQNSNVINQIVLKYDKNPNLVVGDIVSIDKESFYIKGNFAVSNLSYTYNNDNDETWEITAKNSDIISSYIDMFRPKEQQENKNNVESMILSEFIEETFSETHTIEDYESDEDKAVRLAKAAWDSETPFVTDGFEDERWNVNED